MKRVVAIVMLLIISLASQAEYTSLALYEMAIKADIVVYGTIENVSSHAFSLKVERSLTGENGSLIIQKFEDWACARRWTAYKRGQRVFLFLKRYKGDLHIMSGGGEGEFPIEDSNIYIHGFTVAIPPPPPPKGIVLKESLYFDVTLYNVHQAEYFGYKMKLSEFIKSIELIRNCFDYDSDSVSITKVYFKCSQEELIALSSKDKLVKWTAKELTEKNR
jgi:hypothetical protein